jgi:hypothetical protein
VKQYVKLLEGKRLKSDTRSAAQPNYGWVHFVLLRTNIGLVTMNRVMGRWPPSGGVIAHNWTMVTRPRYSVHSCSNVLGHSCT